MTSYRLRKKFVMCVSIKYLYSAYIKNWFQIYKELSNSVRGGNKHNLKWAKDLNTLLEAPEWLCQLTVQLWLR